MAGDEEVGIRVKIKEAAKAVAEIGAVKKAIDSVGSTSKKAATDIESSIGVKGLRVFTNLGSGIKSMAQKSNEDLRSISTTGLQTLSGVSSGVKQLGSNMLQYSGVAAIAGAAGIGFGLKTAGSLEQTNVAFKKMLGSQEAATNSIKDLQKFAIESPYDFQTILGNARTLIAKGFDPSNIVNTMKTIGDAVASIADPSQTTEAFQNISYVLGQVNQKDYRLNTKDIYQFQNANISAMKYLTEASGKSVTQVQHDIEKKAIAGTDAARIILAGMNKDFGGMMDLQNKTMLGKISALKDAMLSKLYTVDSDGKVGGTLAPLVGLIERNLPQAAIIASKAMDKLGEGVKSVVDWISRMAYYNKMGGFDIMLKLMGDSLGVGDGLSIVWKHLVTDSKNLATVWQTSLWPAIKNVATILGPFVVGALAILEGTLKWMADHPHVAEAIFTFLGLALATYMIEAKMLGIASALKAVTLGFIAMQVAIIKFPLGFIATATTALKAFTGAGEAAAATTALSYSQKNAKLLAAGGVPAVAAAETGGLGLAAGTAALGAASIGGLYWLTHKAKTGIDEFGRDPLRSFGGHAAGGTMSMGGPTMINEQGQEAVWLPGGSKIMNNKDLMKAVGGSNRGTTVTFAKGAVVVSGTDVLNADRVTDILVQKINDRIARR